MSGIVRGADSRCSRSVMLAMGTRRPRKRPRLCRRCALHWRGNTPRFCQILRATNCEKLSEPDLHGRFVGMRFFLTRPDGTTAAERCFGQKPRSMCTVMVASVELPPAPRSPPRRASRGRSLDRGRKKPALLTGVGRCLYDHVRRPNSESFRCRGSIKPCSNEWRDGIAQGSRPLVHGS